MKNFKGSPLRVDFTHIENDHIKKTIAKCIITEFNVPCEISDRFFRMFSGSSCKCIPSVTIYAETVCKDGDSYDATIGERIARKKIMKKFMSMLRQSSQSVVKDLYRQIDTVDDIGAFASDCEDRIVEWLEKQ